MAYLAAVDAFHHACLHLSDRELIIQVYQSSLCGHQGSTTVEHSSMLVTNLYIKYSASGYSASYVLYSIEGRLICQIADRGPKAAIWHINRPSMLYIKCQVVVTLRLTIIERIVSFRRADILQFDML